MQSNQKPIPLVFRILAGLGSAGLLILTLVVWVTRAAQTNHVAFEFEKKIISILPAFGIAGGAFCMWLAVRIVNRRERWAKRTAVALAVVLFYPLSFGPACWIAGWIENSSWKYVDVPYRPIWRLAAATSKGPIGSTVHGYANFGAPRGSTYLADLIILRLKLQEQDRLNRAWSLPRYDYLVDLEDDEEP
jgi:hypothetical protein